tara:strand:- start:530 stop:1204 length:675 start_codon:yes stop_codon:yes gene_type:complete
MKSYSQFSESLNDLYLKEWEKLDEDTQKEFIRQYAEENSIELDEEALTLAATSPYWVPAALAGAAYLGWKAPGWMKKHQNNKEMDRWLNQSSTSNVPSSSRTNKQREETANREKERINTGNKNNKEEIKNQRESEKINKQLQNRTENPNNPNKKPSNWKKFTNMIKNNPLKSIAVGSGLGYGGLGTLNWYGNKYHNKNNNSGSNSSSSSSNNNNNGKPNPADKW